MVRVRFAPSPTGEMHIGNLRTAIFNWIFAKKNKGQFFLRIEDTDELRSTEANKKLIFKFLQRMKLDFELYNEPIAGNDNGIVTQSLRYDVYRDYAKKIYEKGDAFYCQCPEESEDVCFCKTMNLKEGVLRYKIPEGKRLFFDDMVFGQLAIDSKTLENFAILRSNGVPMYMLTVVVDDIEMKMTHVIRGEDHRTNTFKQILLYESLGYKPPIFGHLPMIVGKNKKKLSKRHGNTSVNYYLNEGYVPDALFNILLKLGWGSGNEEIIQKDKIVEIFDFKDVKRSPSQFDEQKLKNFSGKYLRTWDYFSELKLYIKEKYGIEISELVKDLYPEISKRSDTFDEFFKHIEFLYKKIENNVIIDQGLIDLLKTEEKWQKDFILQKVKNYCEEKNIELKEISMLLRVKITGNEISPDIFFIMEKLGKMDSINRLI